MRITVTEWHDLPETVQTVYAELLDQCLIADAERAARQLPPRGSFVAKTVKGNRYWYLQRSEGQGKTQIYLGPETPALKRWIEGVREARSELAPDRARRRDLVKMLHSAGAAVPTAAAGRVIQVLAERGLFRSGALLVGTYCFGCYCNMLGVRLAGRSLKTADIDILHDSAIALALDPSAEPLELPRALRDADPDFLAVPPFDPKDPSTSFKVRGRELRVDFLTPSRNGRRSVTRIPRLGLAAQALPYLGYLLDEPVSGVILYDEGILVNVPAPARFALHKLWTASQRPPAFETKGRKDRLQGLTLVEILLRVRPADLARAWKELPRGLRKSVGAELEKAEMLEEVVSARRGAG